MIWNDLLFIWYNDSYLIKNKTKKTSISAMIFKDYLQIVFSGIQMKSKFLMFFFPSPYFSTGLFSDLPQLKVF